MQNESLALSLKEDTLDVDFSVKVVDNRLPGFYVTNDGSSTFAVFYTKKSSLYRKDKHILLDSFKVASGDRVPYEEAVRTSKEFFERYLRSKILQRAYLEKITSE